MVSYRNVLIDGVRVFYREAGEKGAPALVLLHGYPSSSHMFRELIPLLAGRFHVIAPDLVGFGHSEAPPVDQFDYTFDRLAAVTGKLLESLDLPGWVLYAHDYGGPIAFRLAEAHPEKLRGLVVQNANAYMEGVSETVAGVFLPLWKERNAVTEAPARHFMTAPMTQFQYTAGARAPLQLNPDAWTLDQALLDRPGQAEIQLALFVDYQHNVARYDAWHAFLREHQPRTLVLWGKGDPLFVPAGAEAFKRDLRDVTVEYLDGGHFALEENAPLVAERIAARFALPR
jgi:pimeloyl-ACP methyl ester carboxylesterase